MRTNAGQKWASLFFCLSLGGNPPRGNTTSPLLQLAPQSRFWRASASDHPVRDGLSTPWLSPSQQFHRVNAGTLLTGINESAMLVILAFVDLFFVTKKIDINNIVLNSPEGKYELLSMTLLLYSSPIKLDWTKCSSFLFLLLSWHLCFCTIIIYWEMNLY